jgi:hypothetical protein
MGLLAVGFGLGVIVATSLTRPPTRSPATPASAAVATGSVLAAALPWRFLTLTNIQWQEPGFHVVLPPGFFKASDPQDPLYQPPPRSLDLIDFRYQLELK